MKKDSIERNILKPTGLVTAFVVFFFAMTLQSISAHAGMKSPPPEKIKAIIIGDRVVDIAYNLGVLPEAMSVRGSFWPMAKKFKMASQILGCPRCITLKKETVPKACRKLGVRRLIVEKSSPYCLYEADVKPENIVPVMAGEGVKIEYVDFTKGLEQAVRDVAKLVERESKVEEVITKYEKHLAAARAQLPAEKLGKRVIILSGVYQPLTGKRLIRVEAPGGYSDRFLLEPLGCTNAGNCFKKQGKEAEKGHYLVSKTRHGVDLSPLITSDPDAIVLTGDAFAVQKEINRFAKRNPAILDVKALKNMELYSLPPYVDSGVLEYPAILRKWTEALGKCSGGV
jgi:hypothetical protein